RRTERVRYAVRSLRSDGLPLDRGLEERLLPVLPQDLAVCEGGGSSMIAALCVETHGAYDDLDGEDPWDQVRDARLYDGPSPVVGYPPCQRWGLMWFGQPRAVKEAGRRKTKGYDAGCFAATLTAVRNFGGVLEHPW